MRYAVVDATKVGLALDPSRGNDIVRIGEMIKTAAMQQCDVQFAPEILVFTEPPIQEDNALRGRNTVVMSNTLPEAKHWDKPNSFTGMLDRSPCGTGTCAVVACLHARGILDIGQSFIHESIIGSSFQAQILRSASDQEIQRIKIDPDLPPLMAPIYPILPTVQGQAWITAHSTIILESSDPFPKGIPHVHDIW